MEKNSSGLYVYQQKDIQMIRDYLEGLTVHGVDAARKLGRMATILESGKSLDIYMKADRKIGGVEINGNTEQNELGSERAD